MKVLHNTLVALLLVCISTSAYAQEPVGTDEAETKPESEDVTSESNAPKAAEEPAEPEASKPEAAEPEAAEPEAAEPEAEERKTAEPQTAETVDVVPSETDASDEAEPDETSVLTEPAFKPVLPQTAPVEHRPDLDEETPDKPAFEFSARLRPRLVLFDNYGFGLVPVARNLLQDTDSLDYSSLQARLSTKVRYGTLNGHFMLQYTGLNGFTGGDEPTDFFVGLHIAAIEWKALESLIVQLGRFEMNYGAQRVIGSDDYHQVGRAWDGLRVRIKPNEFLRIDGFFTIYDNENPDESHVFAGDAFFSGIYATYRDTTRGFSVDAYGLYDFRRRLDGDGNSFEVGVFGARARALLARWLVAEIEAAYQLGTYCTVALEICTPSFDNDISAYFVDSEIGVGISALKPLRAFVGFGIASGDDPQTNTFEGYIDMYPSRHKMLGRMDLLTNRTNLREVRGGLSYEYGIARATLAYHDFHALEQNVRVGGEFDLTLWLDLVDGLKVEGAYGVFIPDDGVSTTFSEPDGVALWASLTAVAEF